MSVHREGCLVSWGSGPGGGYLVLGGCLVPGVPSPRGGCLVPGEAWWRPLDGYCCGRYATYWNAFLFILQNTQLADYKLRRCSVFVVRQVLTQQCDLIWMLQQKYQTKNNNKVHLSIPLLIFQPNPGKRNDR